MKYDEINKIEYLNLWNTMVINNLVEVDSVVTKIYENIEKYKNASRKCLVPWSFIACIHSLETSLNFNKHFHNGDPLSARTIHVPEGRPKTGKPPFSWEDSVEDAIKLKDLHKWGDWSIEGSLYQFERYNGFGYRNKGISSPYLWSYSNHYKSGKYIADGKFDVNAVSKQIGCAPLLKRIIDKIE